jgi:hypothetical protein
MGMAYGDMGRNATPAWFKVVAHVYAFPVFTFFADQMPPSLAGTLLFAALNGLIWGAVIATCWQAADAIKAKVLRRPTPHLGPLP